MSFAVMVEDKQHIHSMQTGKRNESEKKMKEMCAALAVAVAVVVEEMKNNEKLPLLGTS